MNRWISLLDALNAAGNFSLLLKAVEQTGLNDLLAHYGPLTMLAPTDEAFAKLPQTTLDALFGDSKLLDEMLRYHIVEDNLTAAQLFYSQRVKTMQGRPVTCVADKHQMKVNYAQIERPDTLVANGKLHAIDAVLLPVAPPPPPPPDPLLPAEEWIPYQPGAPLRIGDAELVPGDPVMRDCVKQLTETLLQGNTRINTARAVRLGERDTISFRAPRAPSDIKTRDEFYERAKSGLIIGARRLEGNIKIAPGPGSYAEFLRIDSEDHGVITLLDAKSIAVNEAPASLRPSEIEDPVPSAAIFYGTTMCQHNDNGVSICCDCGWWDMIVGTPRCGEA